MLPKAILTLWDVLVTDDLLHIPTGAFVSKNGDNTINLQIGLLRLMSPRISTMTHHSHPRA